MNYIWIMPKLYERLSKEISINRFKYSAAVERRILLMYIYFSPEKLDGEENFKKTKSP